METASKHDIGKSSSISSTLLLTEQFEEGVISPGDYVRRRAEIIGEGDIIRSVVIPLIIAIWQKIVTVVQRAVKKVKLGASRHYDD